MSLIFDALQRSERERSGVDAAVSSATELLQLVERQATVVKNNAVLHELPDASETIERERSFHPRGAPPIAMAVESSTEPDLSNERYQALFAQFPSLQVSVNSNGQLPCLTDSESMVSEKFRFLGVRLRHLRRERPLKRLLITSTIPHEGKSMVAANLACTLARKEHQRTLLLEGDVRRPSLSQLLGLERLPGICEWLQDEHSQITNIYRLNGPGVWVLPAGCASGNPLELLQSRRLAVLMDQLVAMFDWIIIDSPPVLPLADTSVWSKFADGILLVTRQGTTDKRQLQKGLEALDHSKLIGALVNCSQSSASGDHYYYYRSSTVGETTVSAKK